MYLHSADTPYHLYNDVTCFFLGRRANEHSSFKLIHEYERISDCSYFSQQTKIYFISTLIVIVEIHLIFLSDYIATSKHSLQFPWIYLYGIVL